MIETPTPIENKPAPPRPLPAGRRLLLSLLLALAPLAAPAQEKKPAPPAADIQLPSGRLGGIDLESRDEVQSRLDAVKKELEGVLDADPRKDLKRQVLNLQIDVLQKQLALLDDLKRQAEIGEVLGKTSIEDLQKSRDQLLAEVQNVDAAAEIAPLREIAGIEALQQAADEKFIQKFQTAKEEAEQAAGKLARLVAEQADLPRQLEVARAGLSEAQAKLQELQQLSKDRSAQAAEEELIARRTTIREQGVYHHRQRIEFLRKYEPDLARLIEIAKIQQEEADLIQRRARAVSEAASSYVKQRLDAESDAAKKRLQMKQDDLRQEQELHQILFKEEDVAIQRIEADHKARRSEAVTIDEKQKALKETLDGAASRLQALRDSYGGVSAAEKPPTAEEVSRTIQELQDLANRSDYVRDRKGLLDARKAAEALLESTLAAIESLDADFAARIEAARTAFERRPPPDSPGASPAAAWEEEARRWGELKARKAALLKQEKDTLEKMVATLERSFDDTKRLYELRRETLLLLRRENLFLRGESQITAEAVMSGIEDLALLPEYLLGAVQGVTGYLEVSEHRQSLLIYLGSAALAALLLLSLRSWMTRRVRGLETLDLEPLPTRTALTMTYFGRALCLSALLFLIFYLAVAVLPDLPEGNAELLRRLGLVAGLFWFGRVFTRELFHPQPATRAVIHFDPVTAARARICLQLLLYVSLVFVPFNLALYHLGYSNEGAIELLWVLYEIIVVLILMALLVRRHLVLGFLPAPDRALARLARYLVLTLYPAFLLLVPTLLILDLFQFDILAGMITGLSVAILIASLAGYLAYHGISFGLNRWLEARFPDREEEDGSQRRFLAAGHLLRFFLKLGIIAGVFFLVLVFRGATFADIKTFLDVPLPFQEGGEGRRITWWNLVLASTVFIFFLVGTRHAKIGLRELALPRTRLDSGVQYAITALIGYALVGLGTYFALTLLFDLQKLGYILAALTVGLGFGLTEIVSNFVSGLILLFERPLKVGDIIKVRETEGVVKRINIRSTAVQTLDNITILVPNKDFVTQSVVNYVYGDAKIRITIPVGVAYGSDVALVRKVLLEVAGDHGLVLRRPSPEVRFEAFGDNALQFSLLVWVGTPFERFRVSSDLTFAIDAAFRRSQIEIAFPQRDLHIRSSEPLRVVYEAAKTDGKAAEESPKPERAP